MPYFYRYHHVFHSFPPRISCRYCIFLIYLCSFLQIELSTSQGDLKQEVLREYLPATAYLTVDNDPRARCLDGSSGVVWISLADENMKSSNRVSKGNWLIGSRYGGWCSLDVPINLTRLGQEEEHTVDHCYSRSLYYKGSNANISAGDTTNLLRVGGWADYLSRNKTLNPVMFDWNFAWIMYCDGTSLSGRREDVLELDGPVGKRDIYFRGSYIRDAVFSILVDEFELGKQSMLLEDQRRLGRSPPHVAIAGQSAGGLAAFLHLNWWGDQLAKLSMGQIFGISDGGFFLDWDTCNSTSRNRHEYFVESYREQMRLLFHHSRADVDKDCVTYHRKTTNEPWRCFFAQFVSPFLRYPVFVLNSQFDSWQLKNELGYYKNERYRRRINAYGLRLSNAIENMVTMGESKDVLRHGAFLDACQHHLKLYRISIQNVTMMSALSSWANAQITGAWGGVRTIYRDLRQWPCTECCLQI